MTGIQPSNDGSVLYVSLADRVLALDPRTLTPRRELDVADRPNPIDHVAPALPPIPDRVREVRVLTHPAPAGPRG